MATFASIVSSMINFIRGKNSTIDTSVGTVVRDVVIECPANELTTIYTDIANTAQIAAFYANAATLTTDQMDEIAENWGITRGPAIAASGIIRFAKTSVPTGADVTVTSGTVVSTSSSSGQTAISFATTETVVIGPTQYSYDPATGYYYVDANMLCSTAGAAGNVGASAIQLFSGVPGIDVAYNPLPTAGGSDGESNTALASRIRTKLMGNNYGTKNGYVSLMAGLSSISEISITGPGDPGMKRSIYGGKVDVGIRPISTSAGLSTYSESFTFSSSTVSYVLSQQPARSISLVTGTLSAADWTFSSTTDYSLTKDTGENSGSVRAMDEISWLGINNPDPGTLFTVSYIYFSAAEQAQNILDADAYHILTADALARESEDVSVDVAFTAKKFSGYSTTTVQLEIITSITNYLNALIMGSNLDESDIIHNVYTNVPGVDNIILPFTTFRKTDSTGTYDAVDGRLTETKNQYFAVGTLTITIT